MYRSNTQKGLHGVFRCHCGEDMSMMSTFMVLTPVQEDDDDVALHATVTVIRIKRIP